MIGLSDLINLANSYEKELPAAPEKARLPTGSEIAAWIDHTLLKPEASADQIRQLCEEARQYQFASVCVNPVYVPLSASLLAGSPVKVCTVVGFPLGASLPPYKLLETQGCLQAGAVEIDMVLSIGVLKSANYGQVLNEIQAVAVAVHNQKAILKVIIETALLSRLEKITACLLCKEAGADFVKTSTGFAASGAIVEDVELMRRVVGPHMGIKAAGGVRSLTDALAMISAGATRIGSSAGVRIVQEAQAAEH